MENPMTPETIKRRIASRMARFMPKGIPKYVRCYDNGGRSFDRYTVLLTGKAPVLRCGNQTEYPYIGMSEHPFHPQGFGQHGGHSQPVDTLRPGKSGWFWPPAMGRKNHLGKRIPFSELPPDCQKLVIMDYKQAWKLTPKSWQPEQEAA
jgi:hypothetical protein